MIRMMRARAPLAGSVLGAGAHARRAGVGRRAPARRGSRRAPPPDAPEIIRISPAAPSSYYE